MTELTARPPRIQQAELIIAYVLRYGVLLCGAILAFGVVLMLFKPGIGSLMAEVRSGNDAALQAAAPRTLEAFEQGLRALEPNTVIALGLVLLIALPIVRVGLTTVIFIMEKDRTYVVVTAFVLIVLISGLLLGREL